MNDTARSPSPYLPTAVAAASLASALWLLLVSIIFGMVMNHSYKEEQYQRTYFAAADREKSQATQVANVIAAAVMLLSTLTSLALIITAFCFWPRHILAGKVLTVASAVLFFPFLCCGVFLGQL